MKPILAAYVLVSVSQVALADPSGSGLNLTPEARAQHREWMAKDCRADSALSAMGYAKALVDEAKRDHAKVTFAPDLGSRHPSFFENIAVVYASTGKDLLKADASNVDHVSFANLIGRDEFAAYVKARVEAAEKIDAAEVKKKVERALAAYDRARSETAKSDQRKGEVRLLTEFRRNPALQKHVLDVAYDRGLLTNEKETAGYLIVRRNDESLTFRKPDPSHQPLKRAPNETMDDLNRRVIEHSISLDEIVIVPKEERLLASYRGKPSFPRALTDALLDPKNEISVEMAELKALAPTPKTPEQSDILVWGCDEEEREKIGTLQTKRYEASARAFKIKHNGTWIPLDDFIKQSQATTQPAAVRK